MDDGLSNAVQEVFVRLYEDDLVYRGKRLVNWDPKLHTAISDLEVENKDKKGHMWHFRYPLADGVKTAQGLVPFLLHLLTGNGNATYDLFCLYFRLRGRR